MTAKLDGTNGLIQQYDYQVLTTGFSYTFASGIQTLVVNPAGVLATGTVTMPASPADGMVITITSTQPITVLTVAANTGQTINNGGALGLSAGGSLSYVYRSANTAWQPFDAGVPLGVGQTWQTVTRAIGTTYTNTTGKPIALNMFGQGSGTGTVSISININSAGAFVVAQASCASNMFSITGSIVIPPGASYVLTVSGVTSITATELR